MLDICRHCGMYQETFHFSQEGTRYVCQTCSTQQAFRRFPLFVITGASGTGKSTIALPLTRFLPECIVLEGDIFMGCREFNAENDHYDYRDYCLRVAKDIQQNGRPVVLVGTSTPGQYEQCSSAGFFSEVYYIALTCSDEALRQRLETRPQWRDWNEETIQSMIDYNRWYQTQVDHDAYRMDLLDNTDLTVEACAQQIATRIQSRLMG